MKIEKNPRKETVCSNSCWAEQAPKMVWVLGPITALAATEVAEVQTAVHLLMGACLPDL